MNELLPCPFCGDTELEGGKPFPSDRKESEWIIRCGQEFCGAEIRFPRKEHAIAAWNFRKQPTAAQTVSDEMVEAAYIAYRKANTGKRINIEFAALRAGLEAALARGNEK